MKSVEEWLTIVFGKAQSGRGTYIPVSTVTDSSSSNSASSEEQNVGNALSPDQRVGQEIPTSDNVASLRHNGARTSTFPPPLPCNAFEPTQETPNSDNVTSLRHNGFRTPTSPPPLPYMANVKLDLSSNKQTPSTPSHSTGHIHRLLDLQRTPSVRNVLRLLTVTKVAADAANGAGPPVADEATKERAGEQLKKFMLLHSQLEEEVKRRKGPVPFAEDGTCELLRDVVKESMAGNMTEASYLSSGDYVGERKVWVQYLLNEERHRRGDSVREKMRAVLNPNNLLETVKVMQLGYIEEVGKFLCLKKSSQLKADHTYALVYGGEVDVSHSRVNRNPFGGGRNKYTMSLDPSDTPQHCNLSIVMPTTVMMFANHATESFMLSETHKVVVWDAHNIVMDRRIRIAIAGALKQADITWLQSEGNTIEIRWNYEAMEQQWICTYCHHLAKEGGGVAVCKSCDERVCHNVCMRIPQYAGRRVTSWECEACKHSPHSQGDGPTVNTTKSKSPASRLPTVLAMGDVTVGAVLSGSDNCCHMVVEIRGKAVVVMWKLGAVVDDSTQAEHTDAEAWAKNKWEPVMCIVLHESTVHMQDVFTLALCKQDNPLRLQFTCGRDNCFMHQCPADGCKSVVLKIKRCAEGGGRGGKEEAVGPNYYHARTTWLGKLVLFHHSLREKGKPY